jgi:hypothetical protein
VDPVADGSFEAGIPNPFWEEASTNFGSPLGTGTSAARTGSWFLFFGGIAAFEEGSVEQMVTLPAGTASLRFYLATPQSSLNGRDYLRVFIDDQLLFEHIETPPTRLFGSGYGLIEDEIIPVIQTPEGVAAIAVADADNDGILDLLLASANASDIAIHYGNGDGTFLAPSYYYMGHGYSDFSPGDINADGNIDLVTGGGDASEIVVSLQKSSR